MSLDKIIINVSGVADLDSTIKKLQELGLVDEKNAKSFQKNNKATQGAIDNTTKKTGLFGNALANIGPLMAGAFAVGSVVELGKKIVETTAKFEKFEAVLTNTLGSKSEAQKAIRDIQNFASKTPFGVAELTESFVKLANQGFKPTQIEMRKLGDLASSTGKSFDQLTEAIIDAQTGEFERLKEFGIRASKEGDKVKFTFKGVETQTQFTSSAIRDYVLSLGDAVGVSGSMAAISETVGGKISNMDDAFDSLFNTLGSAKSGIMKDIIGSITNMVQGIELALLTQEQLQAKLDGMASDARSNEYFAYLEKEVKKLEAVSTAEEARRLVYANEITFLEEELAGSIKLLANQKKMFGEGVLNDFQKNVLKDIQKDIDFYESSLKRIEEVKDGIDKSEAERAKAAEAFALKNAEDEKKRIKEKQKAAEEAFRKEVDLLKGKNALEQNIEKQKYVDGLEDKKEYEQNSYDIELKGLERLKALYKRYSKDVVDIDKQILDAKIRHKEQEEARLKAIQEDRAKEYEKAEKEITEAFAENEAYKTKIAKEEEEKRKQARQIYQDLAISTINTLVDYFQDSEKRKSDAQIKAINQQATEELKALDQKRDRDRISQEAYEKQREYILKKAAAKEAEIKTKQAKDEKKFALVSIALNTAIAVLKGIAQFGPPPSPAGIAAIASALVTGGLQAATVAATPIPKFKDGVIDFKGKGTETSDSNLVKISKGESVMTAAETRNYRKELEAMRKGTYEKYRQPVTRRESLSEARHNSMTDNLLQSMSLHNEFSDQGIVNAIKDSRRSTKEDIKLASMIASKISDKVSENNLFR